MRTTLLALLTVTALVGADGALETPADRKASEVLPAAWVTGAHSQVLDPVSSDGFLNVYRLRSKYGELRVVSTATLQERIHEFDAMAAMEKLKGTQEFANAVGGKVNKVVQGGANLVTDPLGTTEKAFTGVGRMFRSLGDALTGGGQAGGDGTISEISGFSSVKRAYARQFQVDPYSRNPYLQDELKDISRAGFLGGTVTSLGLGAVGGAAGTALTVVSTTKDLSDLVSQPPDQVEDYCSDRLSAMGVSDDLADLFLHNENYTITERTAIVKALDGMAGVENRASFIRMAVLTHDPDVAGFRRRQARLYAAYHAQQKPLRELKFLDPLAFGLELDGTVVVLAPVDHLFWTEAMAAYITRAEAQVTAPRRRLWLAGTASALALRNLRSAGWEVREQVLAVLKP